MDVGAADQIAGARLRPRRDKQVSRIDLTWPGKRSLADAELMHSTAEASRASARSLNSVSLGAAGIVIRGDNQGAMDALLSGDGFDMSYAGRVKLCYLDPPYNTGAQFSTYSDSASSASWLEALRDRLVRIRALLHRDGSVWLHLDDSEQHHARVVLDEVFGPDSFVATVIWEKRRSRDNRTAFSSAHDYIHIYAPRGSRDWRAVRNGLPNVGAFINPDNDPRGPWRSVPMSAQAGHGTKAQFYQVTTPTGVVHDPPPGRCWTYSNERLEQLIVEGRVYWPSGGNGRPRLKRFQDEVSTLAPSTLWSSEFAGDTAQAKKELLRYFPGRSAFDTPKPEQLMERIISIASNEGDLVLDPYLGSGTTAAVAHKLNRRFVGIETAEAVVDEVVMPRLRALDREIVVNEYVVDSQARSERAV